MASVRRRVRSDGSTSWNVRFRYADGTATSRSFSKAHHRDAFLDRLATLRASGVPITAETLDPTPAVAEVQLTVGAWLTTWLDEVLADLTAGHVETLMYEVVAAGHKPSTARRIRATLSSALSAAARRQLVVRNVAQLVELPADRGRRRPSALTDEELDRVLAACPEAPLGALFHLAILTGMRALSSAG